jgi:hypothetical protein
VIAAWETEDLAPQALEKPSFPYGDTDRPAGLGPITGPLGKFDATGKLTS